MSVSCHGALKKIKGEIDFSFALAGNPNVGKSSIFNSLTGMGVVTANYPGKTVEINVAATVFGDYRIGIIDLPGTYAIGAISEDQWVARQGVLDTKPDLILVIVDATNLSRNLYMVLQFLDLRFPIVIALNLIDQAKKHGIQINTEKLSRLLGVPIVPTVATQGTGLDELMKTAIETAKNKPDHTFPVLTYGQDIEEPISNLSVFIEEKTQKLPYGLPSRAIAILLLEQDPEFTELIGKLPRGEEILEETNRLIKAIETKHNETSSLRITRERHGLAGEIAAEVQKEEFETPPVSEKIWHYTTSPLTGIPMLILVLIGLFAFLFFGGNFLSALFGNLWSKFISPVIAAPIYYVLGKTIPARILLWGFDAGINAALSVGIPYVLTFYFILAFLEDTGYLNSVAFLTDKLMHKVGLHGRAIISLVAGAGCNVPAIIGTRVLTTKRERTIASTLIVLVPCSARTAVILGAVSLYAGWKPAVAIYLILFALVAVVGVGLNKIMPGESEGLVMEMFPFRAPSIPTILKKTWYRFKDFVFVAFPIVLIGSLVLGGFYETGYLWKLAAPLSPITGWLGLPAVAGITLIIAVLRKELALQLLATLAIVKYGNKAKDLLFFMNTRQLFVYALVNTIYIPCIATIAVLGRELGTKRAIAIIAFTISLAILIGGLANKIILYFNLLK